MHNGHGAVGHGVELVEAAGLEARGHEEDVCPRGQPVRHAAGEPHPPPALLEALRLHLPAVVDMLDQCPMSCEDQHASVILE